MSKEEQLVKVNIDSKAFGNELIFSKLQMSLKKGEIIYKKDIIYEFSEKSFRGSYF